LAVNGVITNHKYAYLSEIKLTLPFGLLNPCVSNSIDCIIHLYMSVEQMAHQHHQSATAVIEIDIRTDFDVVGLYIYRHVTEMKKGGRVLIRSLIPV
jgi:hypothetical protein